MISFDQFCDLPAEEIAEHIPKSMIFAAGGTRRAAKLVGIDDQHRYVKWSSQQLAECFALFARYGLEQILTHAIVPTQWMEVTPDYREKLVDWVTWILTSEDTIAEYKRRGWRACLIGADHIPALRPVAEKLSQHFSKSDYSLTVYYLATPRYDSHWRGMAEVLKPGWRSQEELILAQYHEAISPVKLYVGYGKPVFSPAVCPPALGSFEGIHSYWLQKPGYVTDHRSVLAILYDYAITRKTWMRDKSNRTEKVLAYRDEFSQKVILGLGKRLGPFWYPQSIVDHLDDD